MSWLLLPAGEIAEGASSRMPELAFATYDEKDSADLTQVEFYVPPYMGGPETVELLSRLPSVRVVQTLTIGVDWVRDQVPDGVSLCNARGVHEDSTAELVLAGVLSAVKDIPGFVRAQWDRRWDHHRVGALAGSTVMIIGHGAIGSAVSERLLPFQVEVIGVTRSGGGHTHRFADVRHRLPEVDVLIVTVPLTPETAGLVDAEMLGSMPRGALVVNASRGAVVDSGALEAEVVSGRLRAVLDVTDPEPLPPDSRLWQLDNVLITPHVGGNTSRFPSLACDLVVEQVRRFRAGDPLVNRVITASPKEEPS